MTITLPIPDRAVSPNARRGQSRRAAIAKAGVVKRHRLRAKLAALKVIGDAFHVRGLPVPAFAGYSLAHFFKTAALRDDDNADAACKAYRDGIAEALGMDDRGLRKLKLSTIAKDAANPRVEITLYPSDPL